MNLFLMFMVTDFTDLILFFEIFKITHHVHSVQRNLCSNFAFLSFHQHIL